MSRVASALNRPPWLRYTSQGQIAYPFQQPRTPTFRMSTLEFLLFTLSTRIRAETGNEELADAAQALASESHTYIPEGGEESEEIKAMADDWHDKFPVG